MSHRDLLHELGSAERVSVVSILPVTTRRIDLVSHVRSAMEDTTTVIFECRVLYIVPYIQPI